MTVVVVTVLDAVVVVVVVVVGTVVPVAVTNAVAPVAVAVAVPIAIGIVVTRTVLASPYPAVEGVQTRSEGAERPRNFLNSFKQSLKAGKLRPGCTVLEQKYQQLWVERRMLR